MSMQTGFPPHSANLGAAITSLLLPLLDGMVAQSRPAVWKLVDDLYQKVQTETHRFPHSRSLLSSLRQQPVSVSRQHRLTSFLGRLVRVDPAFAVTARGLVDEAERGGAISYIADHNYAWRAQPTTSIAHRSLAVADEGSMRRLSTSWYQTLTVVIHVRARPSEPERARNVMACLRSLCMQDVERHRYRIVAVEQDFEPRLRHLLAPFVDDYVFAHSPGAYNRARSLNIGARFATRDSGVCLMDADLLVPSSFLRQGLTVMRTGCQAFLPYEEVLYLDEPSSRRAIEVRFDDPPTDMLAEHYRGYLFRDVCGGCLFVDPTLYWSIGGHDETFQGWGKEDEEFVARLSQSTVIGRLPNRLLHLNHPRSALDEWTVANSLYLERLSRVAAARSGETTTTPSALRHDEGR
jgi:hypothetical protein